jgi:predicted RNA binding protein YcfA (HicA-like mRNA interferase family)
MHEYSKPLKNIFIKHGWRFLRNGSKASHEIWESPDGKRKETISAGMKSRHLANKILSRVGFKERF